MSGWVAPQRLASLDSYYVESRGVYQPASSRLIHLVASIALTIAALYWLDRGLRADRIQVSVDRPRGELVFIAAPPQQLVAPSRVAPRSNVRTAAPDRVNAEEQPAPDVVSNAISTPPVFDRKIDWAEQSAISAAAAVNALTKQDDTLDSKPNVLELPKKNSRSKVGVTQHLGGGETITWISENCYITNMEAGNPSLDANAVTKVCKRNGPDDGMMFDHLRPQHLGGPKSEAGKKKASE